MNNAFQYEDNAAQSTGHGAQAAVRGSVAANDDRDFLRIEDVQGKWPAWKSTSLILLSCGLFWTSAAFAITRLFG